MWVVFGWVLQGSRAGLCWSWFFHGNGKEITGLEELCLLTALLGFDPTQKSRWLCGVRRE